MFEEVAIEDEMNIEGSGTNSGVVAGIITGVLIGGFIYHFYCPFCKKLFDIAEAIGYDGSNPDTAICPDCGGLLEAIYNDENPGC